MGQRDDAARRRFTRTALLLITDFSGNTGPALLSAGIRNASTDGTLRCASLHSAIRKYIGTAADESPGR